MSINNNLFALALVICLNDLVNSHKCSLQGVEAVIVIYDQLHKTSLQKDLFTLRSRAFSS